MKKGTTYVCRVCGGKHIFLGGPRICPPTPSSVRSFPSGATRDTDQGKIDPEGFLSPVALDAFFAYMHKHRTQSDGSLRSSDNWQKGIPVDAYMKSAWRHFFTVWRGYRGAGVQTEDLCALLFNVQGLLHEHLKGGERK